jgi:HAMP domain-containing protein
MAMMRSGASQINKANLSMKQRLIGPTIISLIMCGLFLDHLFFSKSPWSVVNVLSKVLSIFGAIFAAFNPAQFAWLDAVAIPIMIGVLAVLLLALILARAKSAMSKVTPNADASLTWPPPALPKLSAAEMPPSAAVPSKRWQNGLTTKLTVSFGSISLLFGLFACIIVYSYLCDAMDKEIRRHADAMGIHVSEMARRQLPSGDLQELRAQVDSYASIHTVAYVYVEDEAGKIVAHAPRDLPRYLNRDFPYSAQRALRGTDIQYRGLGVYEIAKRITDGKKPGFVHFGIWHAAIKEEAQAAMMPIAASILAIVLGSLGVFAYFARHINRPFFQLVEHAERISKGDFAAALEVERSDEVGEIARSLERMRSSMHAIRTRLGQRAVDQLVE